MGWLLNIALLKDRFYIILFKMFRFGIIRTNDKTMNGISLVFGIWKLELQTNISIINKKEIIFRDYGRA